MTGTQLRDLGLAQVANSHPEFITLARKTLDAMIKQKENELREVIKELVDLMERSDQEEFGEDVKPVTNGEWFGAINRAKALL